MTLIYRSTETKRINTIYNVSEIKDDGDAIKIYCSNRVIIQAKNSMTQVALNF